MSHAQSERAKMIGGKGSVEENDMVHNLRRGLKIIAHRLEDTNEYARTIPVNCFVPDGSKIDARQTFQSLVTAVAESWFLREILSVMNIEVQRSIQDASSTFHKHCETLFQAVCDLANKGFISKDQAQAFNTLWGSITVPAPERMGHLRNRDGAADCFTISVYPVKPVNVEEFRPLTTPPASVSGGSAAPMPADGIVF